MQMIPKKIHYCWFGGKELPEDVKKYIDTWKKYCPDYEIIEWNENNFNVTQNQYCKEAYEAKKWAFVSDYARLKVLYDNGGIYMDTDVEVCKPFDNLLNYGFFCCYEDINNTQISLGTFGCERFNPYIKFLLESYKNRHFLIDNKFDYTTNVQFITNLTNSKYKIEKNKYSYITKNNIIFPLEFFIAKDFFTGKILKTDKTYAIHHYAATWKNKEDNIKNKIRLFLVKYFGESFVRFLFKIKKSLR